MASVVVAVKFILTGPINFSAIYFYRGNVIYWWK